MMLTVLLSSCGTTVPKKLPPSYIEPAGDSVALISGTKLGLRGVLSGDCTLLISEIDRQVVSRPWPVKALPGKRALLLYAKDTSDLVGRGYVYFDLRAGSSYRIGARRDAKIGRYIAQLYEISPAGAEVLESEQELVMAERNVRIPLLIFVP